MTGNVKHLIGAAGMFWERSEVDWRPGSGNVWQMLGHIGQNPPKLKVCDFRHARGFYVLYDHHGPVYVGIARGKTERLGSRLRDHTEDHLAHAWSRFSWVSFDDVTPGKDTDRWCTIKPDDNLRHVDAPTAVEELEALMIRAFGLRMQNQMQFKVGEVWQQATWQSCYPDGPLRHVTDQVTTPTLRDAIEQFRATDSVSRT